MGNVVADKADDFALDIVKLYQYLAYERKEFVMSKQILKSGTSIGANIAESEYAQSKADFIAKRSISMKEANETRYWLKLLYKSDYISEDKYKSYFNKIEEIIKILTASLNTLKGKK